METLLSAMLFVKYAAIVVGISSFTLMCLIGVVIAVDEIRIKLGEPLNDYSRHRAEARHRRRVEDEEWEEFWKSIPHGFENTGEIRARDYAIFQNAEAIRNDLR